MERFHLVSGRAGDDLPFLLLSAEEAAADAPLAVIIHGLGSRKEKMLPNLYAYAQQGLRAAALDIRWHGERVGAGERDERLQSSYVDAVFAMIQGTVQDLSRLLDHLGAARAAVHGLSLGGMITFAALLAEPRLAVASVAMGSPDWLGLMAQVGHGPEHPAYEAIRRVSPLELAAGLYPPRPILLLHGDADETVPVSGSRALYQRLRPAYADRPERLELVEYPGVGHAYMDDMLRRSIAWTIRFLEK